MDKIIILKCDYLLKIRHNNKKQHSKSCDFHDYRK